MNKVVKVSMPLNATAHERDYLKPYQSFNFVFPKIRRLKNAFVTSTGLVCNSKGLVKECYHYNWPGQYELFLGEALKIYTEAQKNAENLLILDDSETYLLAHHPWYVNYYHWLNETIYRLWIVKDETDQMILLLPPKDRLSGIAIDSLKLFKFKNIFHIPEGKIAQAKTLCMPAQKPSMERYNSNILFEISKAYVNHACTKSINAGFGERIYISRKNSSRRKIVNENEVIGIMMKYDFDIVHCENYSFFEQISIFSRAKYLIGCHGAGLTNMLFLQPASVVFELLKRSIYPRPYQNYLFWYMADALGHKYYHQICEPVNINEDFKTADIVVDIELLNKNLELIL